MLMYFCCHDAHRGLVNSRLLDNFGKNPHVRLTLALSIAIAGHRVNRAAVGLAFKVTRILVQDVLGMAHLLLVDGREVGEYVIAINQVIVIDPSDSGYA
jgi:hypothetical protein